jgi:hypothetical protein
VTGFLASYYYFARYDFRGHPGPLIIDSGAFSAFTLGDTIDIRDYARFVTEVRAVAPGFTFAINLDVIGDSAASYLQWKRLKVEYGVETVPVVHHGALPSDADRYVAEGATRLCLGGLVGGGQKNLPWTAAMLRHLARAHPEVLVHGLGVVEGSVSSRLPWYTTDSSASTSAARFAHLRLVAPGGRGGFVSLDLNSRTRPTRHEAELIRSYGVNPGDLRSREGLTSLERNRILTRLAYRTVVREEELENRRRAAARARTGSEYPRDVTRFVVQGSTSLAPIIRDEMEHPYLQPTTGPGVLRTLGAH